MASSSSQSRAQGRCSGVFLSFHHRDIGETYLTRLSGSLKNEGIRTYLDFSFPFLKEEGAASSEFGAIAIAVVILSENYTSSQRCVNQLRDISEHGWERELVVLPLFYRVDPEHVRMPSEDLAWILDKVLEDWYKEMGWREALSGEGSFPEASSSTEAELVDSIVEHVAVLSGRAPLVVPRRPQEELRRGVYSPLSSTASPLLSQERKVLKVYVSFSCDGWTGSYKFIHGLIFAMHRLSGYEIHAVMNSSIEAIEYSQIAIIVFSSGYPFSSRCMKELQKIVECEERGKIIVKLVCYDVYPLSLPEFESWIANVPEDLRFGLWFFANQRHLYLKLARWIVKDVEDVVRNNHSFADLERRSYDVFLSFRGSDSRHTIISHLYRALCQRGIRTFKDSPELEVGQKISELFEAIRKSRIAIIMFSENYARSEWCLEELKLITNLKDINHLTVFPIFYRVSPSEVRLDKKSKGELGSYQFAIEEMEKKYAKDNSKMVEDWKRALGKAGNVIGFTLPEGGDEANCVEEVIKIVMTLLNRVPLTVAPCQIGINARLQEVKPLLKIDPHLNGVLMLGIYGPGGVGKTTLSKAICNDIAHKFDDWCFISEVRDSPLFELQKRLLCYLLREKDLEVRSVDEGKSMIRRRLGNKRVLVILDDVDKPDSLDALAGGIDWFGKGSRIIITTRNTRLLDSSCVECKYEVKALVEAEANYLFRYHAFGGGPEDQDIDPSLVNQFLDYADGLPLALEVVGRSLRSRSASEWESILEKLKQEPPQDITSVLKISFDGLDKDGQELFLDIACFFNGWNKDYVEKVLVSCVFKTTIDIKNLVERCLVTIEGGVFRMHHLLEEMGKNISQGKCSKLDEIPTRIWLYSDFCDLLSKNMVQERRATIGIRLNSDLED